MSNKMNATKTEGTAMNGTNLAKLGRKARADKALDVQYRFNDKFMTFKQAIDSGMFIQGEAKLITKDKNFDDIKPRTEYRLFKTSGAFVVGPKCAFDYLGSKLIKGYSAVDGSFLGKLY
jgi:hypothetical protein